MKYQGSKARIAKNIVPIINGYRTKSRIKYVEPFVGGANIATLVDFPEKKCSDKNPYLIALLDYLAKNGDMPCSISESEYYNVRDNKEQYPAWYVGLVGFCASYGGRFFEGYPRGNNDDGTARDYTNEAIRNIEKQKNQLKGIDFSCSDYIDLDYRAEKCVMYCDPPYRNSKPYRTDLLGKFDSDVFWEWVDVQSAFNPVIISEYEAPPQYISLFEKKLRVTLKLDNQRENTERLFVHEKWVSQRVEYFESGTLFSVF
jgi:DNA adenine methylase